MLFMTFCVTVPSASVLKMWPSANSFSIVVLTCAASMPVVDASSCATSVWRMNFWPTIMLSHTSAAITNLLGHERTAHIHDDVDYGDDNNKS